MPVVTGKNTFLRVVKTVDCIKDKILGKFSQNKSETGKKATKKCENDETRKKKDISRIETDY